MKSMTRKSLMPFIAAGSLTFASTVVLAAPEATVGAGSSSSSNSAIGGHNSDSEMMGSASESGLSASGEMGAALETDVLREEEEAEASTSKGAAEPVNAQVLPGLEETNSNAGSNSPAGNTDDQLLSSPEGSVADNKASAAPSTPGASQADTAAPSTPSADDAENSPGFFERLFGSADSETDTAAEASNDAQDRVAGAQSPDAPNSDREAPSRPSSPDSDRADNASDTAQDRVSSSETPERPSAPSADGADRSPGFFERLFGSAGSGADTAAEASNNTQDRVAGAQSPDAPNSDREVPSRPSSPDSDRADSARDTARDRVSSSETPGRPSASSADGADRSPGFFERLFGGVDSNADAEPENAAFARLDVDDDELISRQEAGGNRQVNSNFDALDVDGSGQLNREEFSKVQSVASK